MKNKNKQTKFPVARIKKIMQKDDDVGKVAQATPIVISKALELFLALIVEEAGKVTAERGSKKVEAYHLKHAVETTEMFDFLKEIVEAVPDPSAGGTIDLDAVAAENAAKKKRSKGKKSTANAGGGEGGADGPAPKRRRKKVKSDEVAEDGDHEENGTGENGNGNGNGTGNGEDTVMGEAEHEHDHEEDQDQEGDDDDRFDGTNSRRPRSDNEDDDWKNDAPFMPSR